MKINLTFKTPDVEDQLEAEELAEAQPLLNEYLEYINNTGGSPEVKWFDDDYEPIGEMVRTDMRTEGLIVQREGKIFLTDKARNLLTENNVVIK